MSVTPPLALVFLLAFAAGCAAAPARSNAPVALALPPEIAAVVRERPDDASVLYQVAAAQARAGRRDEALATLERVEALGTGVDPRGRDGFAVLEGEPRYRALKARIRARAPAPGRAALAYELAEGDLVPEGIAWSARTRELYLGSVKRKIVAVGEGGGVRELVAPGAGGLGAVVGIRVDDVRGELWAVSEVMDAPLPGAIVGVFRFRLPDGALLAVHPVSRALGELLNDLVVAADGAVYVTASSSGSLLRIDPARGTVEAFLPPGALAEPNGITQLEPGALHVACWHGIARVELATRQVRYLTKASDIADGCIDGLYAWRGGLVGVQNCVHDSGRVLRLRLGDGGRRVDGVEVLEAYHPLFDGVTTAALAGDGLFLVGNVQFRKLGRDRGQPFDPVRILRIALETAR
ncbi:MAG: hypothetical protein U0229_16780 [Anaeromyxobacter sp.]